MGNLPFLHITYYKQNLGVVTPSVLSCLPYSQLFSFVLKRVSCLVRAGRGTWGSAPSRAAPFPLSQLQTEQPLGLAG